VEKVVLLTHPGAEKKPKGAGFVIFADAAAAKKAVAELNGSELSGRIIRVNFP